MTVKRYLVLAFLCGAASLATIMHSAAVNIFGLAGIPDYLVGPVPVSALVGVLTLFITFFALMRNRKVVTFSTEVIRELYKVTWPTREETMRSSTVVVLSAVGSALFLALCDVIWAQVTDVVIFTSG